MPLSKLPRAEIATALRVSEDLAQMEAAKVQAAAFRTKAWKKSEFEALKSRLVEAHDTEGLQALYAEFSLAQNEGRVDDDTSATVANLERKHGAEAWIISRFEVALVSALARQMDSEAGAAGGRASHRYAEALNGWLSSLAGAGRIADVTNPGAVSLAALPSWLSPGQFPGRIVRDKTSPDGAALADAQAVRWKTFEKGFREVLTAVAEGREPPARTRGVSWAPATLDGFASRRFAYENDARPAATAQRQRATEAAKAKREALLAGLSPEDRALLKAEAKSAGNGATAGQSNWLRETFERYGHPEPFNAKAYQAYLDHPEPRPYREFLAEVEGADG